MSGEDRPDQEIAAAIAASRSMLAAYVQLSGKMKIANSYNAMYGDILDFVNFRMETANTCLEMIESRKIADSLGLCRSLLENYLLLKLICRGTKYFQLQNFDNLTESQFKVKLREIQDKNAADLLAGTSKCLEVRAYPRAKRHIMYVFEGLKDETIPGFMIPIHYFHFREFRPETMRLDEDDYFVYYETPDDLKKALKGHTQEATYRYRHYLSYDALLVCLDLNGLADKEVRARIDAHYTFLGKFLHPTSDAARGLHERSNVHSGKTQIGMGSEYTKAAILLAAMYVCHLLADMLDEVAQLFESAPSEYIADPGTGDIRQAPADVRRRFPYFRLVYNDATLHEKYNYAIHHVSDEDLKKYGGYAGIPSELVPFNQHIYAEFGDALAGWHNIRVGVYTSPLA